MEALKEAIHVWKMQIEEEAAVSAEYTKQEDGGNR